MIGSRRARTADARARARRAPGPAATRGALIPALFALALVGGCSGPEGAAPPREASGPAGAPGDLAPPEEPQRRAPLVVFLGDSLTAGLGLPEEEAYPALVAAELERRGLPIRSVNAGVSGDTSAGGRARLDWLLRQRPDLLLVELGANDGLRGQPVESIGENLRAIVEGARAAGAEVVLAGMRMPPNYGPAYTAEFEALYPRLARELDVPLIPFLLEGVAADPDLNLADGIHPNAAGHRILAGTVADAIEPLVRRLSARDPRAA